MEAEDKLKIYSAMAETSRKWVAAMDTKAGFISALNAGLLGFVWTGAKLIDSGIWPKSLALLATFCSLVSLLSALCVVLPRASLKKVFGNGIEYADGFKAISFYGYVAANYPKGKADDFIAEVKAMDTAVLAHEALEQHYTICHVAQKKSMWVAFAGEFLILAFVFVCLGLVLKVTL